jgi:superfamily II DNA helicase RecQ
MKLQFFTVPAKYPEDVQQLLNSFCAQHRILTIDKQFVDLGIESYWSICVTIIESNTQISMCAVGNKRDRVDYKEVLGELDFAVYVQLRDLRKKLSEQEGIPAYALFTNEQLAEMVKQRVKSIAELAQIEGVGKARLEKYGKIFVDMLNTARRSHGIRHNETPAD